MMGMESTPTSSAVWCTGYLLLSLSRCSFALVISKGEFSTVFSCFVLYLELLELPKDMREDRYLVMEWNET